MRLLTRIIACALALTATLASSAGAARADGDPASDVLATQQLFLPQDAGIPAAKQAQLEAVVNEANRVGYQIRVALIASTTDLGSITELWNQPADYAKFLGQELSLNYRGPLLVAMPAGFGLYDSGRSVTKLQGALAAIAIHPAGPGLASATITAIRRLAAATGRPLALPRAQAPSAAGGTSAIPWIVFGIGLVLIGIAWTASVRARPVRLGGKSLPTS